MALETLDDALGIAALSYANLSGPGPVGQRVSDDVRRPTPYPTPESNENPYLYLEGYPSQPDPTTRPSDFNTRDARRGYIAMFLNPWQFWQMDTFYSGKLEYAGPNAQSNIAGMAPDTPQRANIGLRSVTSYGDLVTLTTDASGIEPFSGW